MADRTILTADEGMVLTNGINYGRVIYLAQGADPTAYYQITQAEYEVALAAQVGDEPEVMEHADNQ